MKNFGIKLALTGMIGLGFPVFLSAGLLDGKRIVCEHPGAWVLGALFFVFGVAFAILGTEGLKVPLFGKPDESGKQKAYTTIKAVAVLAVVAALIQWWIVSEC